MNQWQKGVEIGLENQEWVGQVNVRGTRGEKQYLQKMYSRVSIETRRDKDTSDMVLHIRGMRGWVVGYMFGLARRGQ